MAFGNPHICASAIETTVDFCTPVPPEQAGFGAQIGYALWIKQAISCEFIFQAYTALKSCDKQRAVIPLGDRLMVGQRTLTPPV